MARPVHADAEATKRRVLDSAASLFSAKGEGNTSMRDIASGASVSLGTVHHYFGSKAGLYQACIDAMYAELLTLKAELEPAFLTGESTEQVVETCVRQGFRFARQHQSALRLVLRSVLDSGELEPERLKNSVLPLISEAAQLLRQQFEFPEFEARLTIQSIVNVIVRYALSTPRELSAVAGFPPAIQPLGENILPMAVDERGVHAVETHLVGIAKAFLGLS